jgi:hypothetical protein
VDVLGRGKEYAALRPLLDGDLAEAVTRAVLARFESTTLRGRLYHLADCLATIATPPCIEALLSGLASEGGRAGACEAGLVKLGAACTPRLLELARHDDPKVALRALRALAAIADPRVRQTFEDVTASGRGPLRWIAIVGLERLGRSSRSCGVLRAAFAFGSVPEKALVLQTLLGCAENAEDVAWTLDAPAEEGLEAPLADCIACFVAERMASTESVPDERVERALDLLLTLLVRSGPRYSWLIAFRVPIRPLARSLLLRLERAGPPSEGKGLLWKWLQARAGPEKETVTRVGGGGPRGTQFFAAPAAAPSSSKPASGPPPRLEPSTCFSVLAPDAVRPAERFVLEVFVHTKEARPRLFEWTSIGRPHAFTTTSRPVPGGETVDVLVRIDDVAPPMSASIFWDGDLGIASFSCSMPADATELTYPGSAQFSVNGVAIASTHFVLSLAPTGGRRADVSTSTAVTRSAFASYATSDREAVLARVQGILKIAPFVDIFLDVLSLRSGVNWKDQIRREILARDAFYLFWSRAARESEWVQWEWRTALEERGIDLIDPIPLEDPREAPPPAELSALHFYDWTLALGAGAA